MEFNWATIGVLVAVWLIGYLLGLLEASFKESAKQDPLDNETPARKKENGENDSRVKEAAPPLETEVVAIYERISGAFKVRLDGKMIEYADNLKPEERERLLSILVKMRPWVEKPKEAEPHSVGQDIGTAPTAIKLGKSEKVEEALAEMAFRDLSMREQIDYLLQKKLEGHPLAGRGICLGSSPSGGVVFQIGLEKYEWLDEIPDPAIREIIQAAITEWEEKTGR